MRVIIDRNLPAPSTNIETPIKTRPTWTTPNCDAHGTACIISTSASNNGTTAIYIARAKKTHNAILSWSDSSNIRHVLLLINYDTKLISTSATKSRRPRHSKPYPRDVSRPLQRSSADHILLSVGIRHYCNN